MPRQTAGGRGSRVGTLSSQSTPLWTIRASMWPSWPCLTWCPCCSTVSMVSQGPVHYCLSSSSSSRLASAWSHCCFFGLFCILEGETSCWGSWGMHGVIGSTLDPVNLIVHKPLDTPDIGAPLLCIIPDCMFVGEMIYLCCHMQICKFNLKEMYFFFLLNTFRLHDLFPCCFSWA